MYPSVKVPIGLSPPLTKSGLRLHRSYILTPRTEAPTMSWKTLWESTKEVLDGLRRLVIVLLLLAVVVMVAVVAWLHMNWVTFVLFSLVFVWIGRHELYHHYKGIDDAVDVAEKRLWALEQRAGLGDAWLEELRGARVGQRMTGGTLAENVHWPPIDEDAIRTEWEEWQVRYRAIMKEMPADGAGYERWKARADKVRAEQPPAPFPDDLEDDEAIDAYLANHEQNEEDTA
jgi:hypothetical protein